MSGGKITRITGGTHTIECENWTVYTNKFTMYAGKQNIITAEKGIKYGNNPQDPPAGEYFVKGWWSDENDNPIKEAFVGNIIKFHVETKNIPDGKYVSFLVKDWDGMLLKDDILTLFDEVGSTYNTVLIKNNRGTIKWKTGNGSRKLIENEDDSSIELYVECNYEQETVELPADEDDFLNLFEKEEIITILVELPHSKYTDKLNQKGLGGHTAIMIGNEYYDYGPQPNSPYKSEGRSWWDQMPLNGNLTRQDMMNILNDEDERKSWNIIGKVCLIDIHIKEREKNKIENWWKERYKESGTYSIFPFLGEQCTTAVRISLEESTGIFSTFNIVSTTQTPEGFLELLTDIGKHTYGVKKEQKLKITTEYAELN